MGFEFDEKLITGISDIDEQHKKLFKTIYSLGNENLDYEKITEILVELRKYVIEHFSTEENYMNNFAYPYFEEHKALHAKFTKDYNDLLLKLADELSLSSMVPSLSNLLNSWLKTHYQDADIKMAEFLKERLEKVSQE